VFMFLVATFLSLEGVWTLPVKNMNTELLIVEKNDQIYSILKMNSITVKMSGSVKKSKCGLSIRIESNNIKISKCNMKIMIVGCGNLIGDLYYSKTFFITQMSCKRKPLDVEINQFKDPWYRLK